VTGGTLVLSTIVETCGLVAIVAGVLVVAGVGLALIVGGVLAVVWAVAADRGGTG